MYHIKPDKRSQNSARLIADGLYVCLKSKNLSDITISDINRASTVSRATFYRLFDNLSDVLEYECDNAFSQMIKQYHENKPYSENKSSFESLFTSFMEYWTKHIDLLDALVDCNRIDIMSSVFMKHTDEIKEILVPNANLSPKELDYFVSTATGAILGVFLSWTKRGKKENSDELIYLLKKSIKTVCTF